MNDILAAAWAALGFSPPAPVAAPAPVVVAPVVIPAAPAASNAIRQVLAAVAPHLPADMARQWADALADPMRAAGIVTPRRIAGFLGQVAEECGGFSVMVENLNYTTAARLCQVWPSRFPTLEAAAPFVSQPERLADLIYSGRMGNGDAASGDGWRFRGCGPIEITGRGLHTRFAQSCGKSLDDSLAWMRTLPGAAASECWYWSLPDHRPPLNQLADTWDILNLTRSINGGLTGITERRALCAAALKAIT